MSPSLARPRRLLAAGAAALTCGALALGTPAVAAPDSSPAPAAADETVPVRIIGFNDLHGNLEPPAGSSGRVTLADGSTVDAGGAAYLATHANRLRKAAEGQAFVVSAGDAIGASPVISALFHDEPTIEVLNKLNVKAMALGNHELDEGYAELQRIQRGGCHPVDGCDFRPRYVGAKFPILGANVKTRQGGDALPSTRILSSNGVKVGIIGVTLQGLPDIVAKDGIRNLRFQPEVRAINEASKQLQRQGVRAQIVLLHQGDSTTGLGGPNSCNVIPGGPAAAIVEAANPQVDGFMLGHSHQAYNCVVDDPAGNPRPVIQGLAFGRLLSVLDLEISTTTGDVVREDTVATNEIVTRTVAPNAGVQATVDRAKELAAPLANEPIGTISADINRAATRDVESPLGNLIADAQLASTLGNGAQAALMNPGGVRADLAFAGSTAGEGDGVVTYGEAFSVQPFGNILQTLTYTGAQLDAVLEQQAQVGLLLQPSATLTYTYSQSAPVGDKVSDIAIDGVPVDPAGSYRITVNNFLAAGGDGFTTLTAGTNVAGGEIDLDAFINYLAANPGIAPPAVDRVTIVP